MSYNLFLDDVRNPKDCRYYPGDESEYDIEQWIIVRSFDEFKNVLETNGIPKLVSFDYDLKSNIKPIISNIMPNWCQNNITITPLENEVAHKEMFHFMKRLITEQPEDKFVFFKIFHPIPESESKNWYNWCCQNWGTKWDLNMSTNDLNLSDIREIILSELLNNDNYIEPLQLDCSSAWSPPIEGLIKVSKDYPNLNFYIYYEEGGMSFAGEATIVAGECNHTTLDYDSQEESNDEE